MNTLGTLLDIMDHFLDHPNQIAVCLQVVGMFAIAGALPALLRKLKFTFFTVLGIIAIYGIASLIWLASESY